MGETGSHRPETRGCRLIRNGAFSEAFRAELLDLLVWRRDVRRFKRDALPDDTLARLVAIACLAPSVGLS